MTDSTGAFLFSRHMERRIKEYLKRYKNSDKIMSKAKEEFNSGRKTK